MRKIIHCLFTVRGPTVHISLKGRSTYFPCASGASYIADIQNILVQDNDI